MCSHALRCWNANVVSSTLWPDSMLVFFNVINFKAKTWESSAVTNPWQVIRDRLQGFAYSLVVTYCTGLYAGASITLDGNKSYTFKTRPPVLPGRPGANLSLSVFSQEGGVSRLERTLEFQPTSRPYYLVQKELFEKGASQQQSSSDAWTGVFNYTIPWKPMTSECGYAKSLPIPFCNGLNEGVDSACDGFCGAIASHVSLETMKEALQVPARSVCFFMFFPFLFVRWRGMVD